MCCYDLNVIYRCVLLINVYLSVIFSVSYSLIMRQSELNFEKKTGEVVLIETNLCFFSANDQIITVNNMFMY